MLDTGKENDQVLPESKAVDVFAGRQAELLFQNAGIALAGSIAAAVLVLYYFYGHTDNQLLFIWFGIFMVVSMLRYAYTYAYRTLNVPKDLIKWVRGFEIGAGLSGVAWGLAPLLILPPDSFLHLVMLSFVIGGLCAGTVAVYPASRYASPSFVVTSLIPAGISLLKYDVELALPLAIITFIYMTALIVISLRIFNSTKESLLLDMHNKGLVDSLGRSLHEKDDLNTQLSNEVHTRKQAEAELFREKERAEVTLASLGDGVITTDSHGYLDYINPAAEKLVLESSVEAYKKPLEEILTLENEKSGEVYLDLTRSVIEDKVDELSKQHTVLIRKDGTRLPILFTCSAMRNKEREIIGAVIVFRDVSELRRLEEKLSYEASHDSLTGLINRREFEQRLVKSIQHAENTGEQSALMYLDLDQFKVVNDTSGHIAGDEMLKQVTGQLAEHVRGSDVLARLGGDEFGILLENCPLERAEHIADTLRQVISKLHFVWDDKIFETSVSIGLVPVTDTTGGLGELMRSVDSACYIAKDDGRNRVHVHSLDDDAVAERHGELQWVHRIKNAVEDDRIVLFVQRIDELSSNCTDVHYEILMRMRDEQGELVPPMSFIPAAERYDLMPMLDRHVIRKSFSLMKQLDEQGQSGIIFSINLSGQSFRDEDFLAIVIDELSESAIDPETVCFEITETAAIGNLTKAKQFIAILHGMGCKFSLDDFGSGLSSFGYLKNLNVDYLKIDGCFVKDIEDDPVDEVMVESINQVGHALGMLTIAEFVENDAIIKKLQKIGVDFVQGYGVEKPRPFTELFK